MGLPSSGMADPKRMPFSVNNAMGSVLQNLGGVADFFWQHGQRDAANRIGQLSVEIAQTVSSAYAEVIDRIPQLAHLDDELLPDQDDKQNHCDAGAVGDRIAGKKANGTTQDNLGMSQQTSLSRNQTASQGLEQPKAVTRSVPAMAGNHPSNWPSAGRVMPPSGHSNESTRGPSQTLDNGGLTEGVAGVVFVQGATTGPNFVNFLAKEIHEGPIYEFRVLSEDRALIIFLYELHAQVFLDRNREALAITGESVYGPAYTLEAGEPLEWHATLRRMVYPLRERRRLTFARAGLFGDKLTPQKWAQDVRDIAGKGNVEYTWVFNNGNATAVFRSTTVARRVLHAFRAWSETRPVYHQVDVSFSSDPCEKELVLTTQLKNGKATTYW